MLRTALGGVLGFLYPPVCAACGAEIGDESGLCADCFRDSGFIAGPVCDRCGAPCATDVCDACLHAPQGWDHGRAAALYEGAARKAVLALKHGDRLDVARAAAPWLLRAGRDLVAGADLIAPVPLHWTRLARRRFNQSGELARALCSLAGRREAVALDLLARTRRTPSQEGRGRTERIANVAGAFAVSRRWRGAMEGKTVLLVDDVLTTGATLSACAEGLRAAGAETVNALVLARVAREAEIAI